MELLDHPLIGQRYFFPRTAPLPDPTVVRVPGAELHCLHRPVPGAPTVLHFHGNGEVVADWAGDWANAVRARGLGVFLAEYRGYGGSTGEPLLATMLDDALACARAAGPPERLVVYGRSVGSLYALHVAAHLPVAALVLESGIADLLQRLEVRVHAAELGAAPDALRAALDRLFDHEAKLRTYAGPVLVLHARGDFMVTPDHAERLARWAGDRGRLVLFDRGDHNSIHAWNGAAILDAVVELAREACT